MTAVILCCVFNFSYAQAGQAYAFSGILLLAFCLTLTNVFKIFLSRSLTFKNSYFERLFTSVVVVARRECPEGNVGGGMPYRR